MLYCAKKITTLLIALSQNTYEKDEVEVFVYGFECFLNSFFNDCILLIWGILTKTLFETVCWLVIFCIFRHHVGGAHANTSAKCICISSLLGMSNYLVIHYSSVIVHYNVYIIFIISAVCVLFAPSQSTKKKLNNAEKMKEKYISLSIIAVVLIAEKMLPTNYAVSMTYALTVATILLIIAVWQSYHSK